MRHSLGPLIAAVIMLVAACGASQNDAHTVRDFQAWRGVPVSVLETHAFFSTIPKRVDSLSDDNQLWTYSACERWVEDQQCTGFNGGPVVTLTCDNGRLGEHCCHNQFYVVTSTKTVGWYRAIGACAVECDARSAARPCPTR